MNVKKLCIIPLLLVACSIMAQEANLTLKPVVKKKYNVEVQSKMDITQNMGGMDMKINAASTGKAILEIESVATNGDVTIVSEWKELSAQTSAMGKDTTMNFNDLKLRMRTTYDKTGKIIKNERLDSTKTAAAGMIEQMATGMKLPILAGKMVKKGEVWTASTNDTIQPMGAPFSMVTELKDQYTFVGTETKNGKEYYRVNVNGPIKISGEGSQMGMDMRIEGTGVNDGYSLLDKTTLLPVFSDGKVGMDMNIMVSGAQSMAIPMTQNMIVTITFTEAK